MFQKITIFCSLLVSAASCLADIRPEGSVGQSPSAAEVRRGRELLQGVVEKWGGARRWAATGSLTSNMSDHWPAGPARMMAMPWPESGQPVRLSWQVGTDNARLEFVGGERGGEVWGIQNWVTYTAKGNMPHFKADKEIAFWLPTMQYFIEAPFRLTSADVLFYAGDAAARGQQYDLVFASWGTQEPQPDVDQYVLWINRSTGQLDFLQYTVRDMFPFVTGIMHYSDFKEAGGLVLPHRLTALKSLQTEDFVHEMRVASIEAAAVSDPLVFVPDPSKVGKK